MTIEALEQEPTTKNDLGVDCIDRNSIKYYSGQGGYMYASKGEIDKLPSVTPQEPILDKIRAEIQENINYNKKMNYQGIVAGLLLTLNIIDKYKAESEVEDGND